MENSQTQTQKVPFASILDKYDNYFFDCDGVLYNGSHFLKEAFKALNKLKEMGKNVFFVTNTSKNSRKTTEKNLKKGGFEADVDKIFTSSYLAARYLKLMHPTVKKVYLIGLDGLKSELEMENITVVGGHEDSKKPMDGKIFDVLEVDEDIGAVVVGIDHEFNYYKLAYASVLLQKGALFIAANLDSSLKMGKYKMPGAGCMVKAVEHASGRKAHIVGKPCADVIEVAAKDFGLDLKKCLMIGDRLDSDIMVGKNAGIDTFAVLTGCTNEQELLEEIARDPSVVPTYYWDRVEI